MRREPCGAAVAAAAHDLVEHVPQCQNEKHQRHVGPHRAAACALVPAGGGGVRGRRMAANVVQVEPAVEEYLNDEDTELVANLLDIAAAFPSVGWSYMHWASSSRASGTLWALLCDPVIRRAWDCFPIGGEGDRLR